MKTFEEVLETAISDYLADGGSNGNVITALETKLMALKDEEALNETKAPAGDAATA